MDLTALFTVTYGVYVLSTQYGDKKNACIINTLSQVTQEPVRVSITVLKSNYTHDLIMKSNKFCVSVLGEQAGLDLIARFGFQSGRDVDKFENYPVQEDYLGNPVIEEGCLASMTCSVKEKIDLDTHTLFIADVTFAKRIESGVAMTYGYYRDLKMGKIQSKGEAAKKVETIEVENTRPVYQCSICHYVYDGEMPFEELPDDYVCPLCNQPKSVFMKNDN